MSSTADLKISTDGHKPCIKSMLRTIRLKNTELKRESQRFREELASCRSISKEEDEDGGE